LFRTKRSTAERAEGFGAPNDSGTYGQKLCGRLNKGSLQISDSALQTSHNPIEQ
jgi:hypothetical protein